jgi:tetratricopeptide (TPR) repeat protein
MKTLLTSLIIFLVVSVSYSQETAQDLYKKGSNAEYLKKYKEAADIYTQVIALDSTFGEAWASRGMVKYQLKNYISAVDDYNEALKLIPDYAEVYDLRGLAKYELTDKTGACEDWNKSFDLGFNKAYDLIEKYCLDDQKK